MTTAQISVLELGAVTQLYDQLADVVFFAKDSQGRYLAANKTLVERSGFASQEHLVGRLPSELFGQSLGQSYERQDETVLASGRTIAQRLELHVYANKTVGWCLTSKLPILGDGNDIVGVVGISQDIRSPNISRSEYDEVASIVDWLFENLASLSTIEQVVERSGMSQYRLNQRFKAVFGLTVGQWIIKQRIDQAQKLLAETDAPIVEIALAAGYSDQSAFTRQFRLSTGLTPRRFRMIATSESSTAGIEHLGAR